MIRKLVAGIILGSLAGAAGADDADAKKREVLAKLDSVKISLDFKGAQLDEVMEFMHETTQLNFVLSKAVQEKVRNGELKIDIKLDETPLKTALRLMLNLQDLTMAYKRGVFMVETKEERGSEMALNMYDVKDLLMKINDFPGPSLALDSGSDKGPSVVVGEPADEPAHPFDDPHALVNIIRNATGGDAVWGKEGCSIDITNGMLVVVQSDDVKKEVQELIISLRQFK